MLSSLTRAVLTVRTYPEHKMRTVCVVVAVELLVIDEVVVAVAVRVVFRDTNKTKVASRLNKCMWFHFILVTSSN